MPLITEIYVNASIQSCKDVTPILEFEQQFTLVIKSILRLKCHIFNTKKSVHPGLCCCLLTDGQAEAINLWHCYEFVVGYLAKFITGKAIVVCSI